MNAIIHAVDKHRELILQTLDYIRKHPETGYREWNTHQHVADIFTKLGYKLTTANDIPGFYTVIDTKRSGPEVLILGELDALICPAHPDADSETGAAHCCGHNAQIAALAGIAAALTHDDVLSGLSGRIRLCAVPAEELLELDFRSELKQQGKIRYLVGKPEFLRRGYFDGVDLAMMVHTSTGFAVNRGNVGCLAKTITYHGVAAHAGGAPWMGCNALYAANLGLSAINALRETFQENDLIRVHPIITQGGSSVNVIPDTITIESYVRGRSFEAITSVNNRVNCALCGGALALGANIEIRDTPGYGPLYHAPEMISLATEAFSQIAPDINLHVADSVSTGSTDMGDLSCIMPVIHPYAGGAAGITHGEDYQIKDPVAACITSAKWQLAMLTMLLENGGKLAEEICQHFTPRFASKEDYLKQLDDLESSGTRISYQDGCATVQFTVTQDN